METKMDLGIEIIMIIMIDSELTNRTRPPGTRRGGFICDSDSRVHFVFIKSLAMERVNVKSVSVSSPVPSVPLSDALDLLHLHLCVTVPLSLSIRHGPPLLSASSLCILQLFPVYLLLCGGQFSSTFEWSVTLPLSSLLHTRCDPPTWTANISSFILVQY